MRRAAAIALAALALAPARVRAQFRARPMVIPVPSTETAVLAGAFATAPTPAEPDLADLLLVRAGVAAAIRPHQALLSSVASPYAQPAAFQCVAAGRLAENASDASPDVVYCPSTSDPSNQLQIAFGDAPGTLRPYVHALNTLQPPTLAFARLHPEPRAEVIVLPVDTGRGSPIEGELYALDFGTAAGSPAMTDRAWDASSITKRVVLPDEVLTLRISDTARALGVDDLYIPGFGSVTIYPHAAPPTGDTLADVQLGAKVKVGGTVDEGLDPTSWLPPGVRNDDVLGAGALDVDGDGDLDLVIALGPSLPCPTCVPPTQPGRLLWVERTGDVAALATARPWQDLSGHPDLQPLSDVALLRAITVAGEPALAVFDRGTDSVLVVRAGATAGRLAVWRGSAAGRELRSLMLADVVGSPAPDLVADGTQPSLAPGAPGPAVLVWPDLSDASPEIAWAPGNPPPAARGEDLTVAVSARDPDGPFTVDWIVGDPHGTPSASSDVAGGAAATEVAWTLDGTLLCETPPQTVQLTARATDAFGVFDEVSATVDVGFAPPSIALAGALPPDVLALPAGGTAATLEGRVWTRCGAVAFTWGGSVLAAAASVVPDDAGTTTRRVLDLPESSYPALLAGEPTVTLLARDPATGLASPTATLSIALDARGLVEAEHGADAVALAPGEVGVVRTRLRSRTAVALPDVHLVDALSGLAPAGDPRVTGAAVVATLAGGAEVVLDALPPGADVVVELPVRSLGARGASAVEVRSSGGHLLTPAAGASAADGGVPGCGCGGGGAGIEGLVALAAIAALARRRPLT